MTNCPSCSTALPPSAIAESLAAARCPSCKALIDLDSSRSLRPRSLAVAAPERWQVEAAPGSLLVRWRWFTWVALFLVPFTLFWNGILGTMAFAGTEGFTHPERLLFGLLIPHVWVGIGLAYFTLASFFNSTEVRFNNGMLHVKHGPLPWRGQRHLQTREVGQLFVLEKRGNKGGITYELCALLSDGKRISLLSSLNDEGQARFLELRLEQVMGIVDRPVAGELKSA